MSGAQGYEYQILHGGAGVTAIEMYAEERIRQLTMTCVSTSASLEEIRVAQAGIAEMELIRSLRTRLRAQREGQE